MQLELCECLIGVVLLLGQSQQKRPNPHHDAPRKKSTYERQRDANVERNHSLLKKLGLAKIQVGAAGTRQGRTGLSDGRKLAKKRRRKTPTPAVRRQVRRRCRGAAAATAATSAAGGKQQLGGGGGCGSSSRSSARCSTRSSTSSITGSSNSSGSSSSSTSSSNSSFAV